MPTRSCGVICTLALAICVAPCVAKTPTPSQPECKSTVVGDLQKRTFTSTTFGDTQNLHIWLSPGYNDPVNAQKHYPVLYMLDGEKLFDACTSTFHHEWQIDETLTKLIGDGAIEPIIVVGIDSPGDRRGDEYIPYFDPIFIASEPHGKLFPTSSQPKSFPLSIANSASSKTPITPPSEAPPTAQSPPSMPCCIALIFSTSACSKAPRFRSATASSFAIRPRSQSALEEFL